MNHQNSAHAVYRMHASNGELLYIGCTVDLPQRIRQHMTSNGHWLDEVTRIDLEWHPDFGTARAAEAQAIAEEDPRYNVNGTPRFGTAIRRPTRRQLDWRSAI